MQYRYLAGLAKGGQMQIKRDDIAVKDISRKLQRAYALLAQQFPGETLHNKSAFYDHLCALDFI